MGISLSLIQMDGFGLPLGWWDEVCVNSAHQPDASQKRHQVR